MLNKRDLMNMEGIMMLYAIKQNAGKREAAKRLNTSIDTLNKYLNNLEIELGVKLVSAYEKGCVLTENGEKVVKLADVIKQNLQQAYVAVLHETDVRGEVRVAYECDARSNMSVFLGDFFTQYPDITLFIDTFDTVPDMSKLTYDISIGYNVPRGEDLVVVYSRNISFGFFASSKYLAKYSYPQNLDDLLENHRLVVKNSGWWQTMEGKRILQNAKKGICFSNSTFVVNDLAIGGSGIALMPMNFERGGHGMVCLDKLSCDIQMPLYLFSHRSIKDIPKVRAVLDYYKTVLENL